MSWSVKSDDIYDPENLLLRMVKISKIYDVDKFKVKEKFPVMYAQPDVSSDVAKMTTDIKDYVVQSWVRFIAGEMDIDKDWDSYVSNLKKLGLENYIKIHQDYLDSKK